jgi:hypothetical protein
VEVGGGLGDREGGPVGGLGAGGDEEAVLDRELIGGEQGGGLGEAGVLEVDEVAGGGEDQRRVGVAVEEGEALLELQAAAGRRDRRAGRRS